MVPRPSGAIRLQGQKPARWQFPPSCFTAIRTRPSIRSMAPGWSKRACLANRPANWRQGLSKASAPVGVATRARHFKVQAAKSWLSTGSCMVLAMHGLAATPLGRTPIRRGPMPARRCCASFCKAVERYQRALQAEHQGQDDKVANAWRKLTKAHTRATAPQSAFIAQSQIAVHGAALPVRGVLIC